MKVLLIIILICLVISFITVKFKFYKVNNKKIEVYLGFTKIIPLKVKIKEIELSDILRTWLENINKFDQNKINKYNQNKEFIYNILKKCDGKTIFFSINSFYYLDNLSIYLATFYLYSYLQNSLYLKLNKIKKSCFKTRVKKVDLNIEIDVELETKVYKLLIIFLKNIKLIIKLLKEKKNEQSSNNRIIKNIHGKY